MGIKVEGDISGILRPEFAAYLIRQAFGGADTVTANSPVTGTYTHSIPLVGAAGTLPSTTVIVGRKAGVRKYTGCKVSSFKLEGAAGDYVKFTLSLKGKDESSGSLASLPALALQSFKTVGATITMGGISYDAKSVSLSLDNALEDNGPTYGSGLYMLEPVHGQRKATTEVEVNYDSGIETLIDTNLLTDTKLASIVWTLKSPSIITGSTQYGITITLNNVSVTEVTRNVNGVGIITAKISGLALSIGASEPVVASVVDATSSAY